MQSYSLIDEPWLPCIDLEGKESMLGIAGIFAHAHRLRAITGDLPTECAALQRLLVAILYRCVPARARRSDQIDEWAALWNSPELPRTQIDSYLDQHRDGFDLFGDRAFMQAPTLTASKTSGLVKLIPDVPDGEPYFTTRAGPTLDRLSFAEAARLLVQCQAYDQSGIKTGAIGDPRVKGGKGYPIGTGWGGSIGLLLAEGANLKQTLLLNLVLSAPSGREDKPCWERDPFTELAREDMPAASDRALVGVNPAGPAELMTWQSRRVLLIADDDAVTDVLICNGDPIHGRNRQDIEPHTAWRRSQTQEKAHGLPTVYMPARHDPSRALWRGLQGVLPSTASLGRTTGDTPDRQPPKLLEWISALVADEKLSPAEPICLRAIGVEYGAQASSIAAMVDDNLRFVSGVLNDDSVQKLIVEAADQGSRAANALADLARNLARAVGSNDADALEGHASRARDLAYDAFDQIFRHWLAALRPGKSRIELLAPFHKEAADQVERLALTMLQRVAQPAHVGRITIIGGKKVYMDSGLASRWFRDTVRKALPLAAQYRVSGDGRANGSTS